MLFYLFIYDMFESKYLIEIKYWWDCWEIITVNA